MLSRVSQDVRLHVKQQRQNGGLADVCCRLPRCTGRLGGG